MKMSDDTDLYSLPLSCLPMRSRELLSCLLDTPKVIPSDGPVKLPRDWTGIAYLVNVSSQVASYISMRSQKMVEVLAIWQQDRTATVGQLLQHLERIDRYDVYDDLCADLRQSINSGELVINNVANSQNQIVINNNNIEQKVSNPITYHDRMGYEQHYDAFVLYAKEDKQFVDELLTRMQAEGFQLCTTEELQVGHTTPYAPVAQLILERCRRIILICSPEFLSSPANTFYRDYAQAVSIESNKHKIIPIMYRDCHLPSHLAFYHKLYYNESEERALYDFWQKLKQSLEQVRNFPHQFVYRMNAPAMQVPLIELPPSYMDDNHLFLPSAPRSISMNDLDSLKARNLQIDSTADSLSCVSQQSGSSDEKKKKQGKISRILNTLKLKKSKKAMMVAH